MTAHADIILAGVHRGGTRILDALAAPASLGTWLLVDAKAGRADAGALRMRARIGDAVITTMIADAELILPRVAHTSVLVAAVDSVEVTRRLIAESRGTAVLWQLVGRGPISNGGTCFGVAGSIAATDDRARAATVQLLDVLSGMSAPASSVYLTEGEALAGTLLQTLRATTSTTTAMHLNDLAGGIPISSTLTLALVNDTVPAAILDWRDGEHVTDTIHRAFAALRRPAVPRYGAVLVDPRRGRVECWRLDVASRQLLGLVEFDPPRTPREKAIVTD